MSEPRETSSDDTIATEVDAVRAAYADEEAEAAAPEMAEHAATTAETAVATDQPGSLRGVEAAAPQSRSRRRRAAD